VYSNSYRTENVLPRYRGNEAFQLFVPVEDDVDLRHESLVIVNDHDECLPVCGHIVIG
jgi:hypothetical protein